MPLFDSSVKKDDIAEITLTSSQKKEASVFPQMTLTMIYFKIDSSKFNQKLLTTTTVMFFCVGIAAVVLLMIIAGLCISKHRFECKYA